MSSVQNIPNIERFQEFLDNPTGSDIPTLSGAKKYLTDVIKGDEAGPTCNMLIDMFHEFTRKEIKDYVFQRMRKTILLELALGIVSEILAHGIQRAKTIELVVTGTKAKGKTVVIAEDDARPEFPLSEDDAQRYRFIDEASFDLRDSSGDSPGSKLSSGKKESARGKESADPFQTPQKAINPKSLSKQLSEVTNPRTSQQNISEYV